MTESGIAEDWKGIAEHRKERKTRNYASPPPNGGRVGLGFRFSALLRFSAIQNREMSEATEKAESPLFLPPEMAAGSGRGFRFSALLHPSAIQKTGA